MNTQSIQTSNVFIFIYLFAYLSDAGRRLIILSIWTAAKTVSSESMTQVEGTDNSEKENSGNDDDRQVYWTSLISNT